MRFYLTTHKRHWLRRTDVPLFLKSEHFEWAVKWDEARSPYAIDSGGFMELKDKGTWTRPPRTCIDDLRRIWEHVGPYDCASYALVDSVRMEIVSDGRNETALTPRGKR